MNGSVPERTGALIISVVYSLGYSPYPNGSESGVSRWQVPRTTRGRVRSRQGLQTSEVLLQKTRLNSGCSSRLLELGGRYELLQLLGRGGMGIVYKARDKVSGDTVALKLLDPQIASNPGLVERFKSELRLARKVTHKNVCRVYDVTLFGAVYASSMEYIEGETLRQALRRNGTLSVRRKLKLNRVCPSTDRH